MSAQAQLLSEMMEQKTKHGLNKFSMMVKFILVFESKSSDEFDKKFTELKTWLATNLNKRISDQEELNIIEGIKNYTLSEPNTNDRMDSLKYLFKAEFLID